MEAKWSSLVSYGMSLDALQDFLPLDLTLDVKTVRYDTLKVAKRLEAELGDEQSGFIEGDPSDWELLPLPEGFFIVGIDGGYVRNWLDKKHHFEVIVGKSMLRFGEGEEDRTPSLKRFGFVQTLDTQSKRRLYEVLHSQDLQMNQAITFLSDGDDTLRELQLEMSPKATHILDWFHLTMKLTVLGQFGKGLVQCEAVLGEADTGPDRAPEMVAVAWAGRQSAWQDRRSQDLDRALQRDVCPVPSIGQGVVGVAHVYREQPARDPELRGALSQRRGDRDGLCGVDGQRSGQQTILQETADAVVQRRGPFVVTDARADAQRGIGRHLQALVSGHGP